MNPNNLLAPLPSSPDTPAHRGFPGPFEPFRAPAMVADMESASPSVPLSHYLWIFRRNWWKILLFVASTMAAAAVIWSLATGVIAWLDKLPVHPRAVHLQVPFFGLIGLSGVAVSLCLVRAVVEGLPRDLVGISKELARLHRDTSHCPMFRPSLMHSFWLLFLLRANLRFISSESPKIPGPSLSHASKIKRSTSFIPHPSLFQILIIIVISSPQRKR